MSAELPPATSDFESFDHGHQDLVTLLSYSFYGKRKLTGSADHRLRVFDRQNDDSWKLIDTWRGHDAEIIDAKWSTPFMGQIIGSIGEDQKFKVWQEDVYEPPNSGHRFKCIFSLQSSSRIPYVSFDFKTINHSDVYVALLSRDALLTVYEANEPDSMASWAVVDQFHVCAPPARGEETSFKVEFDPNPLPCWSACRAGLREDALSLVTAGMSTAKVWRTSTLRHFYPAADLSGDRHHHGLVRDVAWAPMNTRGWDVIATTCTNGFIRIFEVHTLGSASSPSFASDSNIDATRSIPRHRSFNTTSTYPHSTVTGHSLATSQSSTSLRHARGQLPQHRLSGIGAELASTSRGYSTWTTGTAGSSARRQPHEFLDDEDDDDNEGHVTHTVKEIAAIRDQSYGGVWQAKWRPVSFDGIELITSHEDGSVRVWKCAAYAPGLSVGRNGQGNSDDALAPSSSSSWMEFAVVETDAPVLPDEDDHTPFSHHNQNQNQNHHYRDRDRDRDRDRVRDRDRDHHDDDDLNHHHHRSRHDHEREDMRGEERLSA